MQVVSDVFNGNNGITAMVCTTFCFVAGLAAVCYLAKNNYSLCVKKGQLVLTADTKQ